MWIWLHRLGSPPYFYRFAGRLLPWLWTACVLCLAAGLYWGLVVAPPDYQQGDSYRIMFIHVPSAWLSLLSYVLMAGFSAGALIWRVKVAEVLARSIAPLGASFTFIALVSGSLWGKPMWGTWWVWDARLTSELILLFLYLGFIALSSAFDDPRRAARAAGLLAIVGVVNVPIIHFSVEWWNTLHQGPTISLLGSSSIAPSMLLPLLVMVLALHLYLLAVLLQRARCELIARERSSRWVNDLLPARGVGDELA
ncbi:MAG TPA: heme ABC transporter permease CcmC [Nitrococcus sp.]|nr:heme ABC transporter permease CcmC [Nitrococcus sp.]